jgi:predicted amidohydrolase
MAYADMPFETAIVSATRRPARLLQLDRELGTLDVGKRADLSAWSDGTRCCRRSSAESRSTAPPTCTAARERRTRGPYGRETFGSNGG